jgi:ABC-2 type transport system permease protein
MSRATSQYGAVSRMRLQMLRNSLRTKRGQFELGARVVTSGVFLLVWGLVSLGLGYMAWQFTTLGNLRMLPLLLWPVLVLWQVIPIMLSSFQEGVDLSLLLRFPVSFRSYVLLYLFFGLFDLSSLMGAIVLFAIWLGIAIALPHLMPVAALALSLFGAFNLLLTRMIFAWIDKWLAKRKTREILGIVLLFAFLSLQLLNPAVHKRRGGAAWFRQPAVLQTAEDVQRFFPPGLAAHSIEVAAESHLVEAGLSLGWLALFAAATGALLGIRLRAEYRGESLGEASQASAMRTTLRPLAPTPSLTADHPRSASELSLIRGILTKELLYLMRSGVMLSSLVAPLVLLFIFGGNGLAGNPLALEYALPVGVAYGFLPLTRQVCNSLGGEGEGIQLYFLSPTPLRTVMLAKNLLQMGLFAIEVVLATCIMVYRFGHPPLRMVIITGCWLAFALPVEFAAGNVLSITMAYRMTLTRLSREQGATGNGLVSLLVQILTFGAGTVVYFILSSIGRSEWVPFVFLLMGIGGAFLWLRVLGNVDGLARRQQEALIATLVRTA